MFAFIASLFKRNRKSIESILDEQRRPCVTHDNIQETAIVDPREEEAKALAEVFRHELSAERRPDHKVEWMTVLVGDGMGRIVKLSKKGRDQSEEWESLFERDIRAKRHHEDERTKLYEEGKLYGKSLGMSNMRQADFNNQGEKSRDIFKRWNKKYPEE